MNNIYSTHSENPKLYLPIDFIQAWSLQKTKASFKGGLTAFRKYLLQMANNLGAHIVEKGLCEKIEIHSGRYQNIEVDGKNVASPALILGSSLSCLSSDFCIWKGKSFFHHLKTRPEPLGWRLTLAMLIDEEGLLEAMPAHSVYQSLGAVPLEIELASPGDYELDAGKSKLVFLRSIMPFESESLEAEHQRTMVSRMYRKWNELFPFAERHIKKIYPDFRSKNFQREFSEIFGFVALDYMPLNLRVFSNKTSSGVGSYSGIEGLYVATSESYPDLGSLGWVVAALECVSSQAHRQAHRLGIAGPFG
ncbi:MAG: hypothetical protein HY843_03230 [Bdellovibrio sp.]|nr:hypothetical protein [Bdellovibrio sp.]